MSDRVTLGIIFGACVVVLLLGWLVLFKLAAPILTHRASSPAATAGPSPGKPIPCGPKVLTRSSLGPSHLDFNRELTVGAYRKLGKHNPSWDAEAEAFLEGYARNLSDYVNARGAKPAGALAGDLLAKHCDDPLVLSVIGRFDVEMGKSDQAKKLLSESIAGLKAQGYPAMDLAYAYRDLASLSGETGDEPQSTDSKWRSLALQAFADAADKANFAPGQLRWGWQVLDDVMDTWFPASRAELVKALQARPNTDPWLLDMALGDYRRDYGWTRRGEGWVSSVSPEDLQAFDKAEHEAYDYFRAAYKLHPEYPDSCYYLLRITFEASISSGGSARDWFDRGVADQLDYEPLYTGMLSALMPRWGGSHAAMLAFGKQCLDTGRFDTYVPMAYDQAVEMIVVTDQDPAVLQQADVWPDLQRMFKGYLGYDAKNRSVMVGYDYLRSVWTRVTREAWVPAAEARKEFAGLERGGGSAGGQELGPLPAPKAGTSGPTSIDAYVDVGVKGDEEFLVSGYGVAEAWGKLPAGAYGPAEEKQTIRWTPAAGSETKLILPVAPGKQHILTIAGHAGWSNEMDVLVNGQHVGRMAIVVGDRRYEVTVPATVIRNDRIAKVTLRYATARVPSAVTAGQNIDQRVCDLAIDWVQIRTPDQPADKHEPASKWLQVGTR